jgi:hypothetical protein
MLNDIFTICWIKWEVTHTHQKVKAAAGVKPPPFLWVKKPQEKKTEKYRNQNEK